MAGAFQTGGQWPVAENLDYYAILQVNRNATTEEIEAAHERLSRMYDPETSRKPRAAERHAEVQAAFAALTDRTMRMYNIMPIPYIAITTASPNTIYHSLFALPNMGRHTSSEIC